MKKYIAILWGVAVGSLFIVLINFCKIPLVDDVGAKPVLLAETLSTGMPENPGTVAWLTIPGTNIDGPVQQAADNDYYMRRDAAGEPSQEGCFFADYECNFSAVDLLSPNTIIYGHTFTKADQDPDIGFGQLHRFLKPEFSSEYNEIQLTLNDQTLTFQIVAVGYADATTDTAYIKAYPTRSEFQQIVEFTQKQTIFSEPYQLNPNVKFLTLSTCTTSSSTRLLIVAGLKE